MPQLAIRDFLACTLLASLAFVPIRLDSNLAVATAFGLVWTLLAYKSFCNRLRYTCWHALALCGAYMFRYAGNSQFLMPSHWMFYWILEEFVFVGALLSALVVWLQTVVSLRQITLLHGLWLILTVPSTILLFIGPLSTAVEYAAMVLLGGGVLLTFLIPFSTGRVNSFSH